MCIPYPHGIVVYANRRRLLTMAGVFLGIAALLFATMRDPRYAPTKVSDQIIVVFCIFPFLIAAIAFTVMQALWRRPTLIVAEEGIYDHASRVTNGSGLIPWENVALLYMLSRRHVIWTERDLYIVLHALPPDLALSLNRMGRAKSLAARLIEKAGGPQLKISQESLSLPIPNLLHEIERHYPTQLHEHGIVVDAGD